MKNRQPRYTPGQYPGKTKDSDYQRYMEGELQEIARTFEGEVDAVSLDPLSAPPDRPRPGMLVYFEATAAPDAGPAGFFGYNGAWVRITS